MCARLSTGAALLGGLLVLMTPAYAFAQRAHYPASGQGWGYSVPYRHAFDRGFHEGYQEGRRAGRHGDAYAPHREKDYRRGDLGYNRRYGPREAYRWEFRQGFEAGYARGFRDARRSYRDGPWGGPRWP